MRFREYQAEAHSTSRRLVAMFVFTIALTVAGVNAALWLAWRLLVVNHRHQGSGWTLTVIDGLHWLLVLLVMGAVLGWFGPAPEATLG